MTKILTLTLKLLFLALFVATPVGRAEVSCDDFLSRLGKKPQAIEFLGCKQDDQLQGSPFVARYRAPGPSAAVYAFTRLAC